MKLLFLAASSTFVAGVLATEPNPSLERIK
jgi:hypothetical protein